MKNLNSDSAKGRLLKSTEYKPFFFADVAGTKRLLFFSSKITFCSSIFTNFEELPRNQLFFEIVLRMSFHEDFWCRFSRDLILQKIFTDFLWKIFWRFLEQRFCFKIFSSKNIWKIYINFLQKVFITVLPKIFWRSLSDLQLKSFWNLRKIFGSNLFEIFGRSSSNIVLRSLVFLHQIYFWDLLNVFWSLF